MTTLWKNSSLLLDMANGNQSEGNQFLWSQKTLQSEIRLIHIFLSHLIIFKELTKSSTTPFYDSLHLQGTDINEKNSISKASREVYGKLIKNFLCFKRKRFVNINECLIKLHVWHKDKRNCLAKIVSMYNISCQVSQ